MAFDFTEVLLSLFPPGSLWTPAETEFSYDAQSYTASFAADGSDVISLPVSAFPYFRVGETITVSGSALNDGAYNVLNVAQYNFYTALVVDATLTAEASVAISITRSTTAGALLRSLMGMADNHQVMRDYLRDLAFIREPKLTPILSDLEREYGRLVDPALSDSERRDVLYELVYAPRGTGAASYLQTQLQAAGFDVNVYPNSPASDPAEFSYGVGGQIITNNILYDRTIAEAVAYQELWPFVFFIGGDAVRDNDGRIVHIDPVIIPDAQRSAFRTVVLRAKPVHSWCIAVINDVDYFTFSVDDNLVTDTAKGFANEAETTGGYWYDSAVDGWTYVLVEDSTGDALYEAGGTYLIDG